MGELQRVVSDLRARRGFRSCSALLPVDSWCTAPGRFRFGLPWPWEASDEAVAIVDGTGADLQREGVAQAFAPRSDNPIVFSLWRDDGSLEPMLPSVGRQLASAYRGQLRSVRRVLLGGTRAVWVVIDVPGEQARHWRLVADWSGYLLHGEAAAPIEVAEGYEPHFETMLATWTWG